MHCKDFREIADSYLSDELLVETNLEVLRHLENCSDCRGQMSARREIRSQLRAALRAAPESQISPAFARQLREELRTGSLKNRRLIDFRSDFFSFRALTAAAAVLILSLFAGSFVYQNLPAGPSGSATVPAGLSRASLTADADWVNLSRQAIGDHRHCAKDHVDHWLTVADRQTTDKKLFQENYLARLDHRVAEKIRLCDVHECAYEGREFTHAVMLVDGHLVSVMLAETGIGGPQGNSSPVIVSQSQAGLQSAGFALHQNAVMIVSELPEAENLRLARSLSKSL